VQLHRVKAQLVRYARVLPLDDVAPAIARAAFEPSARCV
jgi:hypothetical protein